MKNEWIKPLRSAPSLMSPSQQQNVTHTPSCHRNHYRRTVTTESLTSNLSRTVNIDEQQAFNVCALTTGNPDDKPSKVIVTLGNPQQRNDIDLFISLDGALVPVEFNQNGVFVFEEPTLNSCALLFITFRDEGKYLFELNLVLDEGNIPLAALIQEITVV